jgi:ABC-type uncharacterized transport system ATPase subunit
VDEKGKIKDIVIQDYGDGSLLVWSDASEEVIRKVTGVVQTYKMYKGSIMVWLDPRYDNEFVKKEIEAAIKIAYD